MKRIAKIARWFYDRCGYESITFVAKNGNRYTEMWSCISQEKIAVVKVIEDVIKICYRDPKAVQDFVKQYHNK